MSEPKLYYKNILPHFHPNDEPYMVVARLHGSIPKSEIRRLRWLYQNASSPEKRARFLLEYDAVLDRNGPYHLQRSDIMQIMHDAFAYARENGLRIFAYSIMPNHFHLVASPGDTGDLVKIMQSLKRHTSRQANIALGTTGKKFWHRESYDHVIRKGRLGAAILYTLNNPVVANLVTNWRDWPGHFLSPDVLGIE